jgi:hypothetical protein
MRSPTSGNAAEAAVLAELIQREFRVLVPFGDGHPYDLVIDLGNPGYLRVQCKTARPKGGCLVFNARTTDHGRGRQSYFGLADLFGVYFPPERTVYLVPVDAIPGFEGRFRLEPTRNNQKRFVRFAAEYEIDRWSAASLADLIPGKPAASDSLNAVA